MGLISIEMSEVGATGLLWMLVSYGYVLFKASEWIAEGSELLLLVPSLAGVVGGVVLPLVAAVPDAAIMLFSGFGADAQSTLSVGVGALAGSTIMVLTVPFGLAVLRGAVELSPPPDEVPLYHDKHSERHSSRSHGHSSVHCDSKDQYNDPTSWSDWLWHTGVAATPAVNKGVTVMMMTTIPYIVIEIPLFLFYLGSRSNNNNNNNNNENENDNQEIAAFEKVWAAIGFGICVLGFCCYIRLQFQMSRNGDDEDKRMAVMKKILSNGTVSLRGALHDALQLEEMLERENQNSHHSDSSDLEYQEMAGKYKYTSGIVLHYLEELLREPFLKYDDNQDNSLDPSEVRVLLNDMNEDVNPDVIAMLFRTFDRDKNGLIDYAEFCECVYHYLKKNYRDMSLFHLGPSSTTNPNHPQQKLVQQQQQQQQKSSHRDLGEMEEMPQELADLEPEAQQRAIRRKAFSTLATGAILVVLFSDPTIEVIQELSVRLHLNPFYVSFVLIPLASNMSEVMSSQYYATKKTSKSITVSLSSLSGSAAMNNTLCLSIFMALVVFRGIAWNYTAETVAIVVVQWIVGSFATQPKLRSLHGILCILLYPLSLVLVYVLEAMGFS